jgi:hypothetical protein
VSMDISTMGVAQRGVVAVARAMGRIVGAIAGALGANRRPRGYWQREPSERNRLLAEISGLKRELDQAYYQMARGDGELGGLLARVRGLKKRLCKARARLRRLDRLLAMSSRLQRSLLSGTPRTDGEPPETGQIEKLIKRYGFEDEGGEFEFESLLDGDL